MANCERMVCTCLRHQKTTSNRFKQLTSRWSNDELAANTAQPHPKYQAFTTATGRTGRPKRGGMERLPIKPLNHTRVFLGADGYGCLQERLNAHTFVDCQISDQQAEVTSLTSTLVIQKSSGLVNANGSDGHNFVVSFLQTIG